MIIISKHYVNLIKKPVIYQIPKRYMFLIPKSGVNYLNLNLLKKGSSVLVRDLSTRAGKLDLKAQLPKTDSGTPIVGDLSGHHSSVVLTSCAQPDCKTTNCADAQKTGPNPCGKDSTYHQGPINTKDKFTNEFVGTITHKVPSHMSGTVLNSTRDTNGSHPKGQSMANENSVTTIKDISSDFKQQKKPTSFVQENAHTKVIVSNLPSDSAIK